MDKILMKLKTCSRNNLYMLLIVLTGTLSGMLLFYFALHRPLMAAAGDYEQQAAESARKITAVVNFQNAHLDMKEYRAELKKREQRVRQYLPCDIAQGEFILYVERLAQAGKMELQLVSPQKTETAEEAWCLPLRLRLAGSYFGLLKFLQGLQEGERLVTVKNMSITSRERVLQADMLVNIYAVPAK